MPGLKQIRRRISSVKNTKQITRAMKLVSAAKLRRAQDDVTQTRHFSFRLERTVHALSEKLPEDQLGPLFRKRSEDDTGPLKRLVIVIAGERGLCGAYNANIIKAAQAADLADTGASNEVVAIGRRAAAGLKRIGAAIRRSFEGLPESASGWPIAEVSELLVRAFEAKQFDEVVVYYTQFVSALTQRQQREVLLPLDFSNKPHRVGAGMEDEGIESWRAMYDPEPEEIAKRLLPMLVRAKLLRFAAESKASEHAARMTAMDSATRNADELIEKLQLFYNRARQNAITRDLIDIVGGAEAQK